MAAHRRCSSVTRLRPDHQPRVFPKPTSLMLTSYHCVFFQDLDAGPTLLVRGPPMPQSPRLSQREHEAAILGTLRRELGETKYDRWRGNASASVQAGEHGQDSQSVVIEVDNAFAARWVETKFIPELRVACKGIRSERQPPWRICVRQDDSVESTECSPADGAKDSTGTPRSAGKSSQSQLK